MSIAKDTILMLSGVPCVGKTTTAYEIIKKYPEFRRVSEMDILRTVVRTTIEHLATEENIEKKQIMSRYGALFESITNSSFETAKLQSKQLLPYIKEIVLRQQRRSIPTIIEGASIIPSTFFTGNRPLEWITEHVIFVNLYLSDEDEHIARRHSRSKERDYFEEIDETKKIILRSRAEKNKALHLETIDLSRRFKNIFSIDISNNSSTGTADEVMGLVFHYYNSQLNT